MSIPKTPIPHHFPQGRDRERKWILSCFCKAEYTPNECIFMPIRITMCFGYGWLACYQVVIYIYTLHFCWRIWGALISNYLHVSAIFLLYPSHCLEPRTCNCLRCFIIYSSPVSWQRVCLYANYATDLYWLNLSLCRCDGAIFLVAKEMLDSLSAFLDLADLSVTPKPICRNIT